MMFRYKYIAIALRELSISVLPFMCKDSITYSAINTTVVDSTLQLSDSHCAQIQSHTNKLEAQTCIT